MIFVRRTAWLLLIGFIAAAIFIATRFSNAVDTDILSLLPGDTNNPVVAAALQRANDVASNRVAFAIEGANAAERQQAAAELEADLTSTGLFQSASIDAVSLGKWLFTHRTSLICPDDRRRLEVGDGKTLADEALRQWYSPVATVSGRFLRSDPLLLTSRLLGCLLPASFLVAPDPSVTVVAGSITASVFRLDVQDRMESTIGQWRTQWEPKGLSLSRAGALFHATYGAAQARKESSLIGGITTVAIILLYWLMFRSFWAPLFAVLMASYSLVIGLAVTLAIFGSIHILALVFGAALIGMVVDYTTYYLITGIAEPHRTPEERRAHIFKPLTLGMLTSVGAFAALLFFPITAFREISMLGGVGLIAAWAGTFFLLPVLEGRRLPGGPAADWAQRNIGRYLARAPGFGAAWLLIVVTITLAIAGYFSGHVLDDVRRFQAPSAQLVKEEARIRKVTGFVTSSAFFLVIGKDANDAIVHEEELLAQFAPSGPAGAPPIALLAASPFDPSSTIADHELIRTKLIEPFLRPLIEKLGGGYIDAYKDSAVSASEKPPYVISALRGMNAGQYWSIVPIRGEVLNLPQVQANKLASNWQLVDPAERYSELLTRYRWLATLGLLGAVLSTGLVLLFVYRQPRALRIMLPTVMALVATPAVTTLAGLPFSFFSAMGLFLVVGAGVDYAIFQWEHPKEDGKWTRVGIFLAALMTCISVGLLGLSSVLPVMSFGLTVALGIFLSLAFSPLVRPWNRERFF